MNCSKIGTINSCYTFKRYFSSCFSQKTWWNLPRQLTFLAIYLHFIAQQHKPCSNPQIKSLLAAAGFLNTGVADGARTHDNRNHNPFKSQFHCIELCWIPYKNQHVMPVAVKINMCKRWLKFAFSYKIVLHPPLHPADVRLFGRRKHGESFFYCWQGGWLQMPAWEKTGFSLG